MIYPQRRVSHHSPTQHLHKSYSPKLFRKTLLFHTIVAFSIPFPFFLHTLNEKQIPKVQARILIHENHYE